MNFSEEMNFDNNIENINIVDLLFELLVDLSGEIMVNEDGYMNSNDTDRYFENLLKMQYQNDSRFDEYFEGNGDYLDIIVPLFKEDELEYFNHQIDRIIELFYEKFRKFPKFFIYKILIDAIPLEMQDRILNNFMKKCIENNLYQNMIDNLKYLLSLTYDWEPKYLIEGYLYIIENVNKEILNLLKDEILLNLEHASPSFNLTKKILNIILDDVVFWCGTSDNIIKLIRSVCLNIIGSENPFYMENFIRKYFSIFALRFNINLVIILCEEYNKLTDKSVYTNQIIGILHYYCRIFQINTSSYISPIILQKKDECSICLEEHKNMSKLTVCGHNFCQECIMKHLSSNIFESNCVGCPYCRAEIVRFPKISEVQISVSNYYKLLLTEIYTRNLSLNTLIFDKFEGRVRIYDIVDNNTFLFPDLLQ
jgi:hypothetical protein